MPVHLEVSVAGWWAGVLNPMEAPIRLLSLLVVGLLGGLCVRAGRSAAALPAIFLVGLLGFGMIGLITDRTFDLSPGVLAVAVVLCALVFVHPRRTGVVAPAVVFVGGALHGLAHGGEPSDHTRSLGYLSGFVFTSCVLLTVGAIVGAAVGRSLRGRGDVVAQSRVAIVEDHALV